MNTEDGIKTKAAIRLDTGRSYFEWGNGMQVIRRGKGRLRTITEESVLHPEERDADERKIVTDKEVRGYAPLYPLPTIIALSFLLDSVEAHLFRKHVCSELMHPRSSVIPIIIYDRGVNS